MIQLYHVYKNYGEHALALCDITCEIAKGEFVFLTGPSGAGKSTLLRLFFGAERATRGQIVVCGENISRLDGAKMALLRRKMGIVFQDFKLLLRRTVEENVALALEVQGLRTEEVRRRTHTILTHVQLVHKRRSFPRQLSGGEQQRVALARALVVEPQILLADEPTGNLDSEQAQGIMGLLESAHVRGTTVIVATHDRTLLANSDRRVLELNAGTLARVGA